ncbi:uncharacterized protein LOC142230782 [Haematobia irritans]|uniref:uncharacterized protein LOC142230782 n=1 Tax=Haematobia irritans TaxID=7368 RepID=UPI003F50C208
MIAIDVLDVIRGRDLILIMLGTLSLGLFTIWNQGSVMFVKLIRFVPLHKSGRPFDVSNYRGIAKLNAIPKVFEKMDVTDVLSHSISSILDSCQHGFRKGLSTTTNLVEFTSHAINQFVVGNQTDVIYTDCSVSLGSHLGPVLFLLFINDLPQSVVNSRILMYADDVKIFSSFDNSGRVHLLPDDLDSFGD